MKKNNAFTVKKYFFPNISHVFLEDKAYKNASLCLCQSLSTVLLIMMMCLNRDGCGLLERIWKSAGKVRCSCAAQTGSRLEEKVQIRAWCFSSLKQENKKRTEYKTLTAYIWFSLHPHIQCIQSDGCDLESREGVMYAYLGKRVWGMWRKRERERERENSMREPWVNMLKPRFLRCSC